MFRQERRGWESQTSLELWRAGGGWPASQGASSALRPGVTPRPRRGVDGRFCVSQGGKRGTRRGGERRGQRQDTAGKGKVYGWLVGKRDHGQGQFCP